MKAVYIREFGGPENLEVRDVEEPAEPGSGEVLVWVRASSLNRADLLQRQGFYPAPKGYSDRIPGLEFSGEIAKAGPNTSLFREGDRVFGITAGGGQAEYLITREKHLAKIPYALTFEEAAAVPEAFITAHDSVFTQAKLRKGETVLIHAVGSGVGLAALQMAKARGAFTIGTSRTSEKLERCKELGLDVAISAEEFDDFSEVVLKETGGNGVDVILDLVGAKYLAQNLKGLALKGRLMLVGLVGGATAEFDMRLALQKRLTIIGTVLRGRSDEEKAEATAAFANDVLPLFENGTVRPNVDRVFSMEKIAEAHEYLESNVSFGKVVISISPG